MDRAILSWLANCGQWKLEHERFVLQIATFIVLTDLV
jgi:hypothetical protein